MDTEDEAIHHLAGIGSVFDIEIIIGGREKNGVEILVNLEYIGFFLVQVEGKAVFIAAAKPVRNVGVFSGEVKRESIVFVVDHFGFFPVQKRLPERQ